MSEYEYLKERIKADVRQCIINDGKPAEDCLDMAVDKYNLDSEREDRIRKDLGDR